jgi:hypothetical protein
MKRAGSSKRCETREEKHGREPDPTFTLVGVDAGAGQS